MNSLKANSKDQTIAVTVYTIVSSTVLVDIDENFSSADKEQIINDIAEDVYDQDSDIEDVYEKIYDVRYADLGSSDRNYSSYFAKKNEIGVYELHMKSDD